MCHASGFVRATWHRPMSTFRKMHKTTRDRHPETQRRQAPSTQTPGQSHTARDTSATPSSLTYSNVITHFLCGDCGNCTLWFFFLKHSNNKSESTQSEHTSTKAAQSSIYIYIKESIKCIRVHQLLQDRGLQQIVTCIEFWRISTTCRVLGLCTRMNCATFQHIGDH